MDIWKVFRNIRDAHKELNLNPGSLLTLQGMIGLTKGEFGIVFASNETLSRRANNFSDRTIRNHIDRLCRAGILTRRDSPNGKRYRVSDPRDGSSEAFGLDLAPMAANAALFARMADQATERLRLVKFLRKKLLFLLARIDEATGLSEFLRAARLALRRKTTGIMDYEHLIKEAENQLSSMKTPSVAANDGQNFRHHSMSEKEDLDSDSLVDCGEDEQSEKTAEAPALPLVLDTCTEAMSYAPEPPRCWRDLVTLAWTLAPMIGIDPALLGRASEKMGEAGVATLVLSILQMGPKVRNHRAYFLSLSLGRRSERYDAVRVLKQLAAARPCPA